MTTSFKAALSPGRRAGLSLIELLCVIAILSILAALYLPALLHAFVRVKHFLGWLARL